MLYYIPTIIKKKKNKKETTKKREQQFTTTNQKNSARHFEDITSLTHDCVLSKHSVVVESVVHGCW